MAEDKDYLEQEEENKEDYENVCFICRRPESKAGKMIDIPGGIHVCMDCMQKSFNSMNNMPMDYSELMKNMPNISMVDLNSLQNEIPKKQRIKKYLLTKGNQLGIITVTVMITVKKENNKAI